MSLPITQILKSLFSRCCRSLELYRYNNFTIAEYFRKQGAHIGENCIIVPRSLGSEPYLVKLGNHVVVNQGVVFHTHDGGTWVFRQEIPDLRVFGPIVIEDNCLIGENAMILPNVTIGENSIVGAGSVVLTDVRPNSIVIGVPARRFGSLERYKKKCVQLWAEQKPPNLHPDAAKNYATTPNQNLILSQLKEHLVNHFREQLK